MTTNMPSPHPILYSFRRCPYAMRGRMGLYQAGISVVLREIILRDKPACMLKASPKGTVPVLVLPDGSVIDESLDILFWALRQNDPDNWLGGDKTETDFLIKRNDGDFKDALDRYKYPSRYPDEDCAGARAICENVFQDLNDRLTQQIFLNGNHITVADIAIFPFIRQCAHVDKDWFNALPLPYLQRWLEDRLQSPLFKAIMKKHDVWKPDTDPVFL